MNKRKNISITLEQAREWYKNGNATLRKLALAAFTEEEIEPYGYERIKKEIGHLTTCDLFIYPKADKNTVCALHKLRNIACFLNEGWSKVPGVTGFFITCETKNGDVISDTMYGWYINSHTQVKYPGIIYFKSKDAAVKALKIAHTEGWLYDLK